MKLYFCTFCILFLLISCVDKKETHPGIEIPIDTIKWDSFSEKEINAFPAGHLVKSRKYIKLDSEDKYIFSAADKIIVLDDIYILDKHSKRIIIFNKKGEGINVLDKVGQGPEEYVQITDFSVDRNGNIHVIDGNIDKQVIYNRDCEFVSSTSLPFEVDVIHCLSNDKILLGLSSWNTKEEANRKILIVDKNLNVGDSFLSYDEYRDDNYWISYYNFISTGSAILYNKPIDDYVYSLSEQGVLERAFYFDFGANSIPYDWRKDIESNLKKIGEGYKSLKNHTMIAQRYIIGTLWDKTETKLFLVDRNENVIYLTKPIGVNDVSDFVDYHNNSIVSLIYPGKYEDIYETDFPGDVKDYLAEDNFVICLTELL